MYTLLQNVESLFFYYRAAIRGGRAGYLAPPRPRFAPPRILRNKMD